MGRRGSNSSGSNSSGSTARTRSDDPLEDLGKASGDAQSKTTTKRKGLRELQRDFTRKRLLEAALEVFEEKGYSGATIDEIATRAGASRGTFYIYFSDKAEAMAVVADAATNSLVATGGITDLTEKEVERWLNRIADFLRQNRSLFRAWHEGTVVSPYLNEIAQQLTQVSAERFVAATHKQRAVLTEDDTTRALVFQSTIEMILTRWIIYGWQIDGQRAIRIIAKNIVTAMSASSGPQSRRAPTPPQPASRRRRT